MIGAGGYRPEKMPRICHQAYHRPWGNFSHEPHGLNEHFCPFPSWGCLWVALLVNGGELVVVVLITPLPSLPRPCMLQSCTQWAALDGRPLENVASVLPVKAGEVKKPRRGIGSLGGLSSTPTRQGSVWCRSGSECGRAGRWGSFLPPPLGRMIRSSQFVIILLEPQVHFQGLVRAIQITQIWFRDQDIQGQSPSLKFKLCTHILSLCCWLCELMWD